ncbi:hypothetical protein CcaverHIS002_0609290 [Cutaneotrichosporon cavernicola]|nr:hypothetical protein CcaverHIS002_0609290 [Cutaneotrichosporon cavernicola]BEJ02193.1 hypothetical protein CcaverHIS631_0608750 [Cutaneotrichosporon cavernicola]
MRLSLLLLALVGSVLAKPLSVPVSRAASSDAHTNGMRLVRNGESNSCVKRTRPNTVVLDGSYMLSAAKDVAQGGYGTELTNILTLADYWMTQGPWTVTSKKVDVPGGTKKDYASQAPYWWPANWNDPSSSQTCPYVQRDGLRNPDVDLYTDRRDGGSMMNSTYMLSLAWWYTGDYKYREHAGKVLRTWFIDEATRMTPNLQHAQIIPCANTGRFIGIIDFSQQYTDVIDAVALLNTGYDEAWCEADAASFEDWNRQFLTWLTDSPFGKAELGYQNNHGAFAAMQIAALASWLGDDATAARYLQDQKAHLDATISANGSQPLEIQRTTSFHYSTFALVAYLRMVAIGQKEGVDVDLWGYEGPEGQSIPAAVRYILPAAASGAQAWPHPEINFKRFGAYDIVQFAADMGMKEAKDILDQIEEPFHGGTWALSPAVQQLDSTLF